MFIGRRDDSGNGSHWWPMMMWPLSLSYGGGLWKEGSDTACHTFLSLGLFALPVCSSPGHASHCTGRPKAIQPSLSQLLTVASGLQSGTPLPHTWPQQLSLTSEEDSTTPYACIHPDCKARSSWPMLPTAACLVWNLGPSLDYICINLTLGADNSSGPFYSQAVGLAGWGPAPRVPLPFFPSLFSPGHTSHGFSFKFPGTLSPHSVQFLSLFAPLALFPCGPA